MKELKFGNGKLTTTELSLFSNYLGIENVPKEVQEIREKLSNCIYMQLLIRGKLKDNRLFTFVKQTVVTNSAQILNDTLINWFLYMKKETNSKFYSEYENEFVDINFINCANITITYSNKD